MTNEGLKAYLRPSLTNFSPNILHTNLSKMEKSEREVAQVSIFQDRQKPFSEFNNLQLLRLLSNSVTIHSRSLAYIQHDLLSINLFSLVVLLFFAAF